MLIKNIDNQKLILKNWKGAVSSLAHTGLKVSQVTRNENYIKFNQLETVS